MIDDDLKEVADLEPDLVLQACIFLLFLNQITGEFLRSERMRSILAEAKAKSAKADEDLALDETELVTPLT